MSNGSNLSRFRRKLPGRRLTAILYGKLGRPSKTYQSFALHYATVYMAMATFSGYLSIYYLGLGYSVKDIGVFTAIGPIVSIVIQPIWGFMGDQGNLNRVHRTTIIGAAILSLLFPLHGDFWYICSAAILYTCFNAAIVPLGDAITLVYTHKTGYRFSIIRMAGTLGYALIVILFGSIFKDKILYIFPVNAFFLILAWISTFRLPLVAPRRIQRAKAPISKIFGNSIIVLIVLFSIVFHVAYVFFCSFISVYMKELSASNEQIGLAMGLSALSEVPILLLIDRIAKRIQPIYLILISGFLMGARILFLVAGNHIYYVYITQTLQGVTFMFNYYYSVMLIGRYAPPELKATTQNILALAKSGIATFIANIGGGYLAEYWGVRNVFFMVSLILIAVSVAAMGIVVRFQSKFIPDKDL